MVLGRELRLRGDGGFLGVSKIRFRARERDDSTMNTTLEFWSWFERSLGRLRALAEEGPKDRILDECHEQLKSIHPDLFFEIGGGVPGAR